MPTSQPNPSRDSAGFPVSFSSAEIIYSLAQKSLVFCVFFCYPVKKESEDCAQNPVRRPIHKP
jgi:hypothetical protein